MNFFKNRERKRACRSCKVVSTTTTRPGQYVHPEEDEYETLEPLPKEAFDKAAQRLYPFF